MYACVSNRLNSTYTCILVCTLFIACVSATAKKIKNELSKTVLASDLQQQPFETGLKYNILCMVYKKPPLLIKRITQHGEQKQTFFSFVQK